MTLDELKRTTAEEILVLVDTEASRENVSRAAESKGWKVTNIKEEDDTYQLEIHRQ
jgi:TusA-related sulfurtransferase